MAYNKFKWRYNITYNWTETAQYVIGASSDLTSDDVEAHNDNNCTYVGWSGSDSTGTGTYANPFRTLQHAHGNLGTGHTIITIIDSNYYYTGDAVDLFFEVHAITLQGIEGEKPILTIDPNIASQVKMVQLAYGGKLVNVELQIPSGYTEQVTAIDAQTGEIRNITIDGANNNAIDKTTTGTVTLKYSIIKNSVNDGSTDGSAITISNGPMDIEHCQLNDNDYCGIIFTGSGVKTITIDYCTITGNGYGIHTTGSSNLSLTITNTINYKNSIYDHEGGIAIYSYCCLGSVNGSPTILTTTPMLRIDPLFISDTDFNLRSIYNGYGNAFVFSPALAQSSTGKDLGCYQYTRVLASQTFVEFETERPATFQNSLVPTDARVWITNLLKPRLYTKGDSERTICNWTGNDNVLPESQFDNIKLMRQSTGNVFLSTDGGTTYTEYLIDRSKEFRWERGVNLEQNDVYKNISLLLLKV